MSEFFISSSVIPLLSPSNFTSEFFIPSFIFPLISLSTNHFSGLKLDCVTFVLGGVAINSLATFRLFSRVDDG